MALAQGTTGVSAPPKPQRPKPQVQYGAPSGPYAAPLSPLPSTRPVGVSGYMSPANRSHFPFTSAHAVQDTSRFNFGFDPANLIAQMFGRAPSSPETQGFKRASKRIRGAEEFAFGPDLVRAIHGENYDPKWAAGEAALSGIIPIKGGGIARKLFSKSPAQRAASYPLGEAPATAFPLKGMGRFAKLGSQVQRQKQVMDAPSMAEHLDMLAPIEAAAKPRFTNMIERFPTMFGERGTRLGGKGTRFERDPMEGMYFDYTGTPRPKNAGEMRGIMEEAYGDDFFRAYDTGGSTQGLGTAEFIHNIRDPSGRNVIGSLLYDKYPGLRIAAHEAYLRPEFRDPGNIRKLVEPLMKENLPIEATFANGPLAGFFNRMVTKGKIKGTHSTIENAKRAMKDPDLMRHGKSFSHEVPPYLLPPLRQRLGMRAVPPKPVQWSPFTHNFSSTSYPSFNTSTGGF